MKSKPLVWLMRIVLAIPAGIVGGEVGLMAGEALGYGIAAATGRDSLKDMLIWSNITGGLVCALLAIWLVLRFTGAGTWPQRGVLAAAGLAAIAGTALMVANFR